MNKAITAAIVLALLGSTASAALAQEGYGRAGLANRGERAERTERNRDTPPRPAEDARPRQREAAPAARSGEGRRWQGEEAARYRAERGDGGGRRDWERRNEHDRTHRDHDSRNHGDWVRDGRDRDWNDGRRDWNERRDWNDRRRAERPRYDRRYYPPTYRLDRRFHAPRYRPPVGFYSHSWVFGDVLPRGWYGPDYRILDWWSYGLPIPPVGHDWVRVGDDVLLVDTFTGRVVQVIYDAFW